MLKMFKNAALAYVSYYCHLRVKPESQVLCRIDRAKGIVANSQGIKIDLC